MLPGVSSDRRVIVGVAGTRAVGQSAVTSQVEAVLVGIDVTVVDVVLEIVGLLSRKYA
jgi:uridine kinase